ncbi:hypothetical protein OIU78_006053 [Salix suchowensis]|nr:hypothetical protein OIU78_006053 [Salix suchowensis]
MQSRRLQASFEEDWKCQNLARGLQRNWSSVSVSLIVLRLRIEHIKIVQERRALPYQMSVLDLEKLISIAREARHALVFLLLFIPFDFFLFYSLWLR